MFNHVNSGKAEMSVKLLFMASFVNNCLLLFCSGFSDFADIEAGLGLTRGGISCRYQGKIRYYSQVLDLLPSIINQ